MRKEIGLPANFTLDACRHGGMTELEEAELTEGQGRALSAHRTRESYAGYAKRTEARMLSAIRKRHAHALANQIATAVHNAMGDSVQNEKSDSSKIARSYCLSVGWGGRIRTSAWWNQNPLPYHLATPQNLAESGGIWLPADFLPATPVYRGSPVISTAWDLNFAPQTAPGPPGLTAPQQLRSTPAVETSVISWEDGSPPALEP